MPILSIAYMLIYSYHMIAASNTVTDDITN